MSDNPYIRQELCLYAARLKQRGLTSATGGNTSYRVGEDILAFPQEIAGLSAAQILN